MATTASQKLETSGSQQSGSQRMSRRASIEYLKKVIGFSRQNSRKKQVTLRIRIFIDPRTDPDTATVVKELLLPNDSGALVELVNLCGIADTSILKHSRKTPDVVLFLLGGDLTDVVFDSMYELLMHYKEQEIPTALISSSSLHDYNQLLCAEESQKVQFFDMISAPSLHKSLVKWLIHVVPDKQVLAANFEAFRASIVKEHMFDCASENAIVGVLSFSSSADLPAMTLNQIKYGLAIGACYSQGLDPARAADLGIIVATAFMYRAFARLVLPDIVLIRLLGKAAIGFGGSWLTLLILKKRFAVTEKTSKSLL